MYMNKNFSRFVFIFLVIFSLQIYAKDSLDQFNDVEKYIHFHWNLLTRDMKKCCTFGDVKIRGNSTLYFPANTVIPPELKAVEEKCSIKMVYLPESIVDLTRVQNNLDYSDGLLYLPHRYVVPGGMFNEMYGWDSYFIIRGLLEDNLVHLAKGMLENLFYEIDHYGSILNANRGYYLTRSQPPFLTSIIMSVYDAMRANGQTDLSWLKNAYTHAVKDYQFWVSQPHLAGKTGLSRYYDFTDGPVVELKNDPDDYYRNAVTYFLNHPEESKGVLAYAKDPEFIGQTYDVKVCSEGANKESCRLVKNVGLTKRFYRSDRATRESGMDISFRFGPYGADTIDYIPIDLNCLLYKAEKDLENMSNELGNKQEANLWHQRAILRGKRINQYLWNRKKGLFFDYNFKKDQQSSYEYISTFYPLWVGLATPKQARAVKKNLKIFEQKGGLVTSTHLSGAQWDYPYGWAPFQLIAIEGLRRYGYAEDANRVSFAFLATVAESFRRDNTLREKYNVVNGSSDTAIKVGYASNEIGFGWTNAVFICLLHGLDKSGK